MKMKLTLPFIALATAKLSNACPFSNTSDLNAAPDDEVHANLKGGRRRILSVDETEETRAAIAEIIAKRSHANRSLQSSSGCMTTANYNDIRNDIVAIANQLTNNRDKGHFFGGIVRLAAHDFMDFDRNAVNKGGPDGCLDFAHPENAGLPDLWCDNPAACPFKALYDNRYSFISQADFWVASANGVVQHTSGGAVVLPFQWGRVDTTVCVESSSRLPRASGCSQVEATFIDRMGLTWRDAVALMGAHTLGRGDARFSGHDGTWVDNDLESTIFNKRYYEEVPRRIWRPRQTSAGVNWTWGGNNRGVMMLNTDICLFHDIPDGNNQNCCTDISRDCRDSTIQNNQCPSSAGVRPEAFAAFSEFIGGTNLNNPNNQPFFNAFTTAWTLATEIAHSDDELFPLSNTCSGDTPAPVPTGDTPAPVPPGGIITTWMTAMLNQLNQERANAGQPPLCYNEKIILAAQAHNQDMVDNDFFSHTGSNGSTVGQRVTAQSYTWNAVRENIAQGQTTVTQVMTSWMNSEGHRANILASNVVHFGAARDIGTNTWTQVFGNTNDGSEGCVTAGPFTPAPVPSSNTNAPVPAITNSPVANPTPINCADRTGKWTIGSNTKNWCKWAANADDPIARCRKKDLFVDCPVTCNSCPTNTSSPVGPTPATLSPVSGPTGSSSCEEEINGRMANLEAKVENIETMLQNLVNSLQV